MDAECVSKNKDMIVGVKVRLSASAANDGANEEEAFRYVFFYFLVRNETLRTIELISKLTFHLYTEIHNY